MAVDGARPGLAVDLFAKAALDYDRVAAWLSYGQYGRWRDRLVREAVAAGLDDGQRVLDVATGTASVARALVRATGCRVVGLDQSPEMLAGARASIDGDGRIRLVLGTADRLPFPDSRFDALTFTYLFRYVPDPAATMRELVRVVKPGGFVGMIEFHVPPHPFLRLLWRAHAHIVLPVGGRLRSRGWYEVGRFLGPNIERFYTQWDVARLADALRGSGLVDVGHALMSFGGGLVMTGRKAAGAVGPETEAPHA